jgi:hypothetical protein
MNTSGNRECLQNGDGSLHTLSLRGMWHMFEMLKNAVMVNKGLLENDEQKGRMMEKLKVDHL